MNFNLLIPTLTITLISNLITPVISNAQTPIRELSSQQKITISGQVKSVVGNNFTLDDGTAQIIVDAGPIWWHQVNVNSGETISVTGEMGRGEFDAFSITRTDGSVIQVRDTEGPPPWSGSRRNR